MIFVSIGNHDQQFTRLVKYMDDIAPKLREKVIIQKGHTKYETKNCESFAWASSLDPYMSKASLIISHGGIGTTLEVLKKWKKPCIVAPRQHKYDEHINNHQLEFCEVLEEKGVKVAYNFEKDLDINTLNKYRKIVKVENKSFENLQEHLRKIIEGVEKKYGKKSK